MDGGTAENDGLAEGLPPMGGVAVGGVGLDESAAEAAGELPGIAEHPTTTKIPRTASVAASKRLRTRVMIPRRARGGPSSAFAPEMWHSRCVVLRRFLGLGGPDAQPTANAESETQTVRRIVRELEQLEPAQRRYLAGFAYILARTAHADLAISADESAVMERILSETGKLPEAQALLVVEIAKHQSELYGGTEDYLVTREFAAHTTEEQRRAVVEACFAVAAADDNISAQEFAELTQIAGELDMARPELNELRRRYADKLAAVRLVRGEVDASGGPAPGGNGSG